MSVGGPFSLALLGVLYRLGTVFAGILFGFMGYRLFLSGLFEHAGDLKAAYGNHHLTLKGAAPGTFFALFGTIVIAVSLWKGVDIGQYKTSKPQLLDQLTRQEREVVDKAIRAEHLTEEERQTLALWLYARFAQSSRTRFIVDNMAPPPSDAPLPTTPAEQLG